MRALIQRVRRAQVDVGDEVVGSIGPGLCVLVGATHTDTPELARRLAGKVFHLRVFDDDAGAMNRSLGDAGRPAALVVSQFTLYGDTARGRWPSWLAAARPEVAQPLVEEFTDELRRLGAHVETGRFGAEMLVRIDNDGPVTLLLEVGAEPERRTAGGGNGG